MLARFAILTKFVSSTQQTDGSSTQKNEPKRAADFFSFFGKHMLLLLELEEFSIPQSMHPAIHFMWWLSARGAAHGRTRSLLLAHVDL